MWNSMKYKYTLYNYFNTACKDKIRLRCIFYIKNKSYLTISNKLS